jgi:hypothetical protein
LRGNIYWACYSLRDVQHRESTESTDEKTAGKFLKARLREVGADLLGARVFTTPKASKITIAELCEALKADFKLRGKASAQNLSHVRRVENDFGTYRATALTPEQIDKYIEGRLAAKQGPKGERIAGDGPASVNRALQLLGQCFVLAVRRGTLNRAPYIRHLSEAGNARQGFFSEQEFRNVLARLPEDLKDFAAFAYITGMPRAKSLRSHGLTSKATCSPYAAKIPRMTKRGLFHWWANSAKSSNGVKPHGASKKTVPFAWRSLSFTATDALCRNSGSHGRPLARRRESPGTFTISGVPPSAI